MEIITTEVIHMRNTQLVEVVTISIGSQIVTVAAMNMGVVMVGEVVEGIVLVGVITIGGVMLIVQKTVIAGVVALAIDGHLLILVGMSAVCFVLVHTCTLCVCFQWLQDCFFIFTIVFSGNHHSGRSDSGWRSRDESKKDSLLPEWAQQDGSHNVENKSTPKVCKYLSQ